MDTEFASVSGVERDRAVGTLVTAFAAEPVVRWIYPNASQYVVHFPRALLAFGGVAFTEGGVWQLGDFVAVALWMPPGVEPDGDATLAEFHESVDPETLANLEAVFGQMDEAHPTTCVMGSPSPVSGELETHPRSSRCSGTPANGSPDRTVGRLVANASVPAISGTPGATY